MSPPRNSRRWGCRTNTAVQTDYNGTTDRLGCGSGIGWSWIQQSTPVNTYDAVGTLEHEISEVLGRTALAGVNGNYELLDMFRYTAFDGGDGDAPGTPVGQRDEPFNPNFMLVGSIAPGSDDPGTNAFAYFSWNGQTVTLEGETPTDIRGHSDVMDFGAFGAGRLVRGRRPGWAGPRHRI